MEKLKLEDGSSRTNFVSLYELKKECKNRNIRGYSTKTKSELLKLLNEQSSIQIKKNDDNIGGGASRTNEVCLGISTSRTNEVCLETTISKIINDDFLVYCKNLEDNSAQIILADPPYNIGKDFGNDSDKQKMKDYLEWCDKWISECLRILKDNGTMFIYGFSEILALILARVPENINRRWLVWHYTNKNVASCQFWQRSHESIIVLWKQDKIFHRDDIREPYTEQFLNGSAGKIRKSTKGRFSKGDKETIYNAHPDGALPRDVIKISALAGGAGMNERVNHPTQKPLALCEKLIKSCKQDQGYVLVPFAGSGSECLAAKNLSLNYIGIEINPDYIKIINERLN
jgi:site-specific DNA-methyltransferase (adenine-specific)